MKGDDTTGYFQCVEGMDHKMVPHVVGWLARHGDVGAMYGVVRDMPWLLGKRPDGKPPKGNATTVPDDGEAAVVAQL